MQITIDELIAIENAYEMLLTIMDEQYEQHGEMDFPDAHSEACWAHDLDQWQCDEVKRMYDNDGELDLEATE